jgi:hypothetical protein
MKRPAKSVLLLPEAILKLISVLLLSLVMSVAVSGQTPSPTLRGQMRELEFLVGEWKGKGWRYSVQGLKSEISQSAKVKIESDGSALRVKDTKKYSDARLIGIPLSIRESTVYYDDEAKLYRWRVVASRRLGSPFEAKLIEPRAFQLVQHTSDSMARTTIRVTKDGEWQETLEFLFSGGWFKVQETFLKRVK